MGDFEASATGEQSNKFSFRESIKKVVPDRFRRRTVPVVTAPTETITANNEVKYLDTVRKTGDPYVDDGLTACTKLIEWDYKIEEELKTGKLFDMEKAFPMLLLADGLGQMNEEQISKTIEHVFQQEANRWETASQRSRDSYSESNDDFDKYNAQKQTDSATAFRTTLQRMQREPGYSYRWYVEQRNQAIEAKQKLYDEAQKIDDQLSGMFMPHREQQAWNSLSGRLSVVNSSEYLQINTRMYGKEEAIKQSRQTGGFVTQSTPDRPGTVVLPIKFTFGEAIYGNPLSGVSVSAVNDSDKEHLLHELTHFSPINVVSQVESSDNKIVKRGFTAREFDNNGNNTHGKVDDFPRQAMEEGAVVFFQKLVRGESAEEVIQMLNSAVETIGTSREYIAAAKLTAETASIVGVDKLLSSYTNSSVNAWLDSIEEKLGVEGRDKYIKRMNEIQATI